MAPLVAPSAAHGDDIHIGIDPSLTGYGLVAYWPGNGTAVDALIKTKAAGDRYDLRLRGIQDGLTQFLTAVEQRGKIAGICIERPAYAASGAFTGGLVHAATALALLDYFGTQRPVLPVLVAGNTLKKFVTGKGNSKKQVVIKYVFQKWGYDVVDDNLADSYGLARVSAALSSGVCQHEYEKQCLVTLGRPASDVTVVKPSPSSGPTSAEPTASTTTARHVRTRSTPSGGKRTARGR